MTKLNQYGPGDPETWGPCTNHPLDPRTVHVEDTDAYLDAQDRIRNERIDDLNGWFVESFTEAADNRLQELADALKLPPSAESSTRIGDIVRQLVEDYCGPEHDEIVETLNHD